MKAIKRFYFTKFGHKQPAFLVAVWLLTLILFNVKEDDPLLNMKSS